MMVSPVHLMIEGKRRGPFSVEELAELWRVGEIDMAKAAYWYRGMPGWSPVAQFTAPPEDPRTPASMIGVTTVNDIANRKTEREVEVISAECVLGMNIWQDFLSQITDVTGGRSETMQGALKQGRRTALHELRLEAFAVGADAVVGVRLTYSEVSGQGKNMLFVVASGTAVLLAPPATNAE